MSSSGKVNPEHSRISHRHKGKDNLTANKLNKFSGKGGLKPKDLVKAVLQILVFIVLGYVFYGMLLGRFETSGGRDEYSCGTDLGDASLDSIQADLEILCDVNEGWQRWDIWDCAYFTMVTITTVGYGDMGPVSPEAKVFTIFFILVGFIVIAGAIGIIGRFFIDKAKERKQKKQSDLEKVANEVGAKLKADVIANTPMAKDASFRAPPVTPTQKAHADLKTAINILIDSQSLSHKQINEVLNELQEEHKRHGQKGKGSSSRNLLGELTPKTPSTDRKPSGGKDNTPIRPHPTPQNTNASAQVRLPPLVGASAPTIEAEYSEVSTAPGSSFVPLSASKPGLSIDTTAGSPQASAASTTHNKNSVRSPPPSPQLPFWEDPEFRQELMKNVRLAWKINKCFALFYAFLVLCFVLGHVEGWTPLDSFYYAIVTGTTVGYGDVAPTTKAGRIFATFLLPFGMVGVSNALGSISTVFEDEKHGANETLMDKVIELEQIIAADDDGTVTEEEFTIFQLTKIYTVDEQTLSSVRNQFKSLDADGSGELDQGDIVQLKQTCTKLGIKASHVTQTLYRRMSTVATTALPRRISKLAGLDKNSSKYSKDGQSPDTAAPDP